MTTTPDDPAAVNLDDVNYQGLAMDLLSLLDAIEAALSDNDIPKARTFVAGRFQIIEAHGLKVKWVPRPVGCND